MPQAHNKATENPKYGPVSVGHDGAHAGAGREHGGIVDGYPVRFAVRAVPEAETGKPARPERVTQQYAARKRKFFGGK